MDISFDKSADYILHLSNDHESTWIIQEKPPKHNKGKCVGDFRRDLNKLKILRKQFEQPIKPQIQLEIIKTIVKDDTLNRESEIETLKITSNEYQKPRLVRPESSSPANPLIDQTVTVIKPTSWIDCISRESKRVFVQDKWIVARILLPPVLKDSIGLKRLTMGDI